VCALNGIHKCQQHFGEDLIGRGCTPGIRNLEGTVDASPSGTLQRIYVPTTLSFHNTEARGGGIGETGVTVTVFCDEIAGLANSSKPLSVAGLSGINYTAFAFLFPGRGGGSCKV
jgi:hypothetical protein